MLWPSMTKVCCKCAAGSPTITSADQSIVPSWTVHPALKTALDSLEAYDRWVASVLMPIAFQWIEEHKVEVYEYVPDDLSDDVGVVVAAAFAIVRKTDCYKEEQTLWQQLMQGNRENSPPPVCHEKDKPHVKVNPVWSDIADQIQEDIRDAFEQYREVLGDTGGYPEGDSAE